MSEKKYYGLDFGTTNTKLTKMVRTIEGGLQPQPLKIDPNLPDYSLPSVVMMDKAGQVVVGDKALAYDYSGYTFSSFKSLLRNEQGELDQEIKKDNDCSWRPSELIAEVFKKVTGKGLQVPYEGTINLQENYFIGVSIPVLFGQQEINVLEGALEKAGINLEKVVFIDEPVAVALQCGYAPGDEGIAMVFDFGGGTLDMAIFYLHKLYQRSAPGERMHRVEVIAKKGLPLGGDDIDHLLMRRLIDKYNLPFDYSILDSPKRYNNPSWYNRLKDKAEELKKMLSSMSSVEKRKVYLRDLGNGVKDFEAELTRGEFNLLLRSPLRKIRQAVLDFLDESRLSPEAFTRVYMTGGSSLLPDVQELLKDIFKEKVVVKQDPIFCIAKGNALRAREWEAERGAALASRVTSFSEPLKHSYAIYCHRSKKPRVILKKGTRLPLQEKVFEIGRTSYRMQRCIEIIPYYTSQENPEEFRHFIIDGKEQAKFIVEITPYEEDDEERFEIYYDVDAGERNLIIKIYDRRDNKEIFARTVSIADQWIWF